MPHKFNTDRRVKIPKQKHRVTNWANYNESLRRRSDLTIWINEDALGLWAAPRRTTRGGHLRASPYPFVADIDATFMQQILDVAKGKWKPNVHHYRSADDLGGRLEVAKRGAFCHGRTLNSRPARLKPVSSDRARTAHCRHWWTARRTATKSPERPMLRDARMSAVIKLASEFAQK